MSKNYLAFDLGASSGRAIIGTLDGGKISLREIHRFTNGPVAINGGLFWNLPGLFTELKAGLAKAVQEGIELAGIAIDTWGIDYTFIDADGFPVGLPRNYRDPRTEDVMPFTFDKIAKDKIYDLTGIQFMSLNTIFQLAASVRDNDKQLLAADKLLFMPNALTYLFCGNISAEYSITTTSALYNPNTGDWAWEIIDALGLKRSLFPSIVPSGTVVGKVSEQLQEELKCGPLPVILIGSHDTASAVAAVPVQKGTNWAYLSSGTWSLIGLELDQPLITAESGEANYTNEGGVGGKIRFLKNIMGLWLIQECRNEWIRQGTEYSWGDLVKLAQAAEPFFAFIDPNDASFVTPGNMPKRIAEFCRKTGQKVPETPGQVIRIALESLAMRYKMSVDDLEAITGKKIDVLHIVGGGCKNDLLNQFTANATGRKILTGPVEATALGNIAVQAIATGDVADLDQARAIIAASTEMGAFLPQDTTLWAQAFDNFKNYLQTK